MLFKDQKLRTDYADLVDRRIKEVRLAHTGAPDLDSLRADKLARTLAAAADSPRFSGSLARWRDKEPVVRERDEEPSAFIEKTLAELPILTRAEFRAGSREVFTRPVNEFLHYYESSGTTGDPVAAPKALEDLAANTINIGEMWGRVLGPSDSALILINGPFAPAGYQFEKVLEYLGLLSVRLWVDNVTGDYTRILRLLRELSISTYVGSPSRLLEMLHFAYRHDEPLPRFRKLMLLAEQTGPALLRHLERLTGARAFVGSFGSSETGTTAATCEHGSLHLQTQSYLFELADARGIRLLDRERADRGELVVTCLDLEARPLLRYQTGDLVEVSGIPCPCGVALPVVRTLGRAQDVLRLGGDHIRQEEVESVLWGENDQDLAGFTVLNYLLALRKSEVVCLVTTDREPTAFGLAAIRRRLATVFHGRRLVLRTVPALPPLASLGSYLGWKLSRLVDLDDQALTDRLPPPIAEIVRGSLADIETAAGPRPLPQLTGGA
ncbi:phenylacetate--CoA ligase family protein [Crossiella cryophila]|uniref:Phenylacetate-CoA ligase n=1 Tax=Crossiella cryophila TaxID=43355 RepID=A0A7W7FV79_9PSEU|nr:phenylacetate--CoA ligase family protein [Crossiella cryophila]MBB4678233.1 phenylacetate-CoA ligase [Crossiella cryophila]